MSSLRVIEQEFRQACEAFLKEGRELYSRVDELLATINNTPPGSLADCVRKLHLLANREFGGAAGDRDDDITSLRQVITFLEDFRQSLRDLAAD